MVIIIDICVAEDVLNCPNVLKYCICFPLNVILLCSIVRVPNHSKCVTMSHWEVVTVGYWDRSG